MAANQHNKHAWGRGRMTHVETATVETSQLIVFASEMFVVG